MSPVRSNFSSAKGKTPSAWFLNLSVTIQCATSGRRQEMVWRARNSIAEDFLFTRLRDNSEIHRVGGKQERRLAESQAPLLHLNQFVPYLTGSPPSRQGCRYRRECRLPRL